MTFQSTWTGILYDVPDPTFPKYVARCARMVYIAEAMAAMQLRCGMLPDLAEAQRVVDGILASEWWLDRFPERPIRVRMNGKAGSPWSYASPQKGEIVLSTLHAYKLTHELAHFAATRLGHHAEFRGCLLAIVEYQYGGWEAAAPLQSAFEQLRLPWKGWRRSHVLKIPP